MSAKSPGGSTHGTSRIKCTAKGLPRGCQGLSSVLQLRGANGGNRTKETRKNQEIKCQLFIGTLFLLEGAQRPVMCISYSGQRRSELKAREKGKGGRRRKEDEEEGSSKGKEGDREGRLGGIGVKGLQ